MSCSCNRVESLPRACFVRTLVLSLLAVSARPASSQETGQLEEVVVTAQKREERLQDVPISDTVVTAAAAQSRGITTTTDLQMAVPGLVINHTANEGQFFIRGVGTNLFGPTSEPTVAMYVDGVYLQSPEANLFSFNNIDRVEVLKGPQGTLFGRNTTGGVIQVITRDPAQAFGGDLTVGYANYDTVSASAYVTGSLAENVAADLALQYENQGDGWGQNFTTGHENGIKAKDNYALRSKWKFTPTEATTIKLILTDLRQYSRYGYQLLPGIVSPVVPTQIYPGRFNSLGTLGDYELVKTKGASIQVEHDAGVARIVNILSYMRSESDYVIDQDVTPVVAADVFLPSLAHNWTEELQIHSPAASKVKWVLGAFYFDAYGAYRPVNVNYGAVVVHDHQTTRSTSGFGQATIPIVEGTNLTLGARYTSDRQEFVGTTFFGDTNAGTFSGSQTFAKTTWRAAIDHHFNEDVMVYVSANRGFKSGGYNSLSFASIDSYKPETLDAYEIGLKTEWLDRRLRWNSAAFFYNYTDIQISFPVTGGAITANGPKARIKGLETELQAMPLKQLELTAGLTYLDGHYTSYPVALAIGPTGESGTIDATGNDTGASPKITGNLGGNYTFDFAAGKLQPNVSVSYSDGFFFYADNRLAQPSYWLLNTSLTWYSIDDVWSVQAWGKNLNNAVYYESRSEQAGLGDVQRQAAPRTYGLTFHVKF